MPAPESLTLESLIAEARALQLQHKHIEAIDLFSKAITEFKSYPKEVLGTESILSIRGRGLAAIFNDRAFSQVMAGHYDDAFADNQAALVHARDRDQDQKARALVDMSYIQRVGYNNVPAARNSLHLATEIAVTDSFFHAKALEFEGRTYQGTTEFEKMIALYSKAAEIYRTLMAKEPENKDLLPRLGDTAHLLGVVYLDRGDFEEASAAQEESLKIYTQAKNNHGIYLATRTVGRIEYQRGNPEKAIEWYDQALAALGTTPNPRNLGSLALNQTQAYLTLENEGAASERWEVFAAQVKDGFVTRNDLIQLQTAVADALAQASKRGIVLPYENRVKIEAPAPAVYLPQSS